LDSTNNRLQFTVNGRTSDDIVLTAKSYESTAELINELQMRIDADPKVGSLGIEVAWVEDAVGSGHLVLTSTTYGANSKIQVGTSNENSAAIALGLAAGVQVDGLDVAGTINGEEATGSGQYLTGKGDNDTTAGLKLRITLTADQVGSGTEGSITIAKGLASKMNDRLTSLNAPNTGLLNSRIASYQKQIDNLGARVEEFDERLQLRRERLMKEYQDMESALAEMSALGDSLTSQLANINSNWNYGKNGN
jgi:flagellar hook-associated protein 2